jgi:hypothetical protein
MLSSNRTKRATLYARVSTGRCTGEDNQPAESRLRHECHGVAG